jgi:hypothetical protein
VAEYVQPMKIHTDLRETYFESETFLNWVVGGFCAQYFKALRFCYVSHKTQIFFPLACIIHSLYFSVR